MSDGNSIWISSLKAYYSKGQCPSLQRSVANWHLGQQVRHTKAFSFYTLVCTAHRHVKSIVGTVGHQAALREHSSPVDPRCKYFT